MGHLCADFWGGLEQEISLRQGKNFGGFAGDRGAVYAHFVGFRIDFDFRSGVVVEHVFLADAAAIFYRGDEALEAELGGDVRWRWPPGT